MKIASWNLGGLRRHNKLRKFREWCKDFDVLLFQENFIHSRSKPVNIPGFCHFVSHASLGTRGRPVGGLSIFISHAVRNQFDCSEVSVNFSEAEVLLLKLTRRSVNPSLPNEIFLFNLYVPSLPKKFSYPSFRTEFEGVIGEHVGDSAFFIGGDFNAHYAPSAGPRSRDAEFSRFLDSCLDEGFKIFPDRHSTIPTFVSSRGATAIDFCLFRGFVSSPESSVRVFEAFGHRAIEVSVELPVLTTYQLNPRSSYRRRVSTLPSALFFSSMCRTYKLKGPLEMLNLGVCFVYSTFLCLIQSFLFVSRPPDQQEEEWHRYLSFNELRQLRATQLEMERASNSIRVGGTTASICTARSEFLRLQQDLRSKATRRLAESVESAKGDHTQLWKVVKNFRLDPDASQGLPVDALCSHFVSLFNRQGDCVSLRFVYKFAPCNANLDARFSLDELNVVLGELERGSAPGPSGIGNDVILSLVEVVGCKRFLLNLFNAYLEGETIPTAWGHCEMFILYKGKGDPLLPSSYRAIALLEAFVKLYERLLCHRLETWAKEIAIIPPAQFGFRRSSGTLDAVFVFWKLVSHFVNQKKGILFAALIDFRSAFPSVDRGLLFQRLADLGLSRKFGCALHSLFESNTFQLRLGNGVTRTFPVTTGLKEGSVLSPLLFSIFVADLEAAVLGPLAHKNFLHDDCYFQGVLTNGLMFADDLVIFARSERGLRERLKLLEGYVTKKKLTVNTTKCEIVPFGASRDAIFRFRFGGQVIPVVHQCKYLGILFGQINVLEAHVEHLKAKFQNAVSTFFRLGRKLALSDLRTWRMLQTSLLFSVLYGVELLENSSLPSELEVTYRKGLRAFIGIPNRVSNDVLDLLFPDFSFELFFLKRKQGFLRRMSQTCDTLASVFFLEDRITSFPAGRGFSFDLQQRLRATQLGELIWTTDQNLASFAFQERQSQISNAKWVRMAEARSTRFLVVVFGNRELWHEFVSFGADKSRSCLRICLLVWTGSIEVASGGQASRKCPFCSRYLDTRHYFTCEHPAAFQLEIVAMARHGQWAKLLQLTLNVYFRFLFRFRPSILLDEESCLLDWSEATI